MAVGPGGAGCCLVASDGGVFAFDEPFAGSLGAAPLNRPIIGMSSDAAGNGYTLVGSDGGVFSFNTPFYGSRGANPPLTPVVAISTVPTNDGYYLVSLAGVVFAFGSAVNYGSVDIVAPYRPVEDAEGAARVFLPERDGASPADRPSVVRHDCPGLLGTRLHPQRGRPAPGHGHRDRTPSATTASSRTQSAPRLAMDRDQAALERRHDRAEGVERVDTVTTFALMNATVCLVQ
jgi:hypothetical protein